MRFLLCVFLFSLSVAKAQVVLRIVSLPPNTPNNVELFVAGNFNGWNPSDTAFRFTKVGNFYEVILPRQRNDIECKITRGSWQNVEADAMGNQRGNRVFTSGQKKVVEINIEGWEKQATSSALAEVSIISNVFPIPQLSTIRRVWIYLPADYAQNKNQHYPVLYMHDGQNVFDAATSFSGEWGVDETIHEQEKLGKQSCIVVAIDNGGAERLNEYSPYYNNHYKAGGKGDAYVEFLVHTLKPFIDSTYRTLKDKKHTAIAGSSMGGLISFYAIVKYPEVYGKAGVFSPAFRFSDSLYHFVSQHKVASDIQLYFIAGTKEGETMIPKFTEMIKLLEAKGYPNSAITQKIIPEGQHNEQMWDIEFDPFYEWLWKDLK